MNRSPSKKWWRKTREEDTPFPFRPLNIHRSRAGNLEEPMAILVDRLPKHDANERMEAYDVSAAHNVYISKNTTPSRKMLSYE